MTQVTIRQATEDWIDQFNFVPGSIFAKLADHDDSIRSYDSDSLRLLASPRIECLGCGAEYDGELALSELQEAHLQGRGGPCPHCMHNTGDDWILGFPQYAFPCGWGTLFVPKNGLDQEWLRDHAAEVAALGFYVFESEDFGILLGIDAGGFDFFDAYWVPLYRLRGLKWHEIE